MRFIDRDIFPNWHFGRYRYALFLEENGGKEDALAVLEELVAANREIDGAMSACRIQKYVLLYLQSSDHALTGQQPEAQVDVTRAEACA